MHAQEVGRVGVNLTLPAAAIAAAIASARSCDGISRRILRGIISTESGGDPLAVHDDSDERSYYPRTWRSAAALVVRLSESRHSFSVGLSQIENVNFARFRVSPVELLNPGLNVVIGCAIYAENVRLLTLYNTGSIRESFAGDRYAEAVLAPRMLPARMPEQRVAERPSPRATPFAFGTLAHPVVFGGDVRLR